MAVKLLSWTLNEKLELITDYERSGLSKAAFAKMKSIPRTSLCNILSSKEKIENSIRDQNGNKRKKLRTSKFEEIEETLLKWFKSARTNNVPISGLVLKEKALEIAKEFEVQDFSASNGWIERFKERHGLSFKKICGEASSVNIKTVDEWKKSCLKDVLQRYDPTDVYNLDETGLFFRLLPEKTLCYRSETCTGGKKSKERLTVLLGANMSGTDKLKPLVIGKSEKPRSFKNVKSLPVSYKANSRAWMTSKIWEENLKSLDKKFHSTKRKVAFAIDNCTAHTDLKGLKSIELVYLPPNATSLLQPLDQGIILNFKRNYRKRLVKDWIKAIDEDRDYRPSVLDAVRYIHASWNDISSNTIENCFKHAGFIINADTSSQVSEDNDDEDVPLSILFEEILNRKKCTLEECACYVDIDKDVATSSEATIAELVAEVREIKDKSAIEMSSDESRSDEETENEKPPSKTKALECIDVIRRYISSINETTFDDHDNLYKIEKKIVNSSRGVQTHINSYFSVQ